MRDQGLMSEQDYSHALKAVEDRRKKFRSTKKMACLGKCGRKLVVKAKSGGESFGSCKKLGPKASRLEWIQLNGSGLTKFSREQEKLE